MTVSEEMGNEKFEEVEQETKKESQSINAIV